MWHLPHHLHGGVQDEDGGGDDPYQGCHLQKYNKVSHVFGICWDYLNIVDNSNNENYFRYETKCQTIIEHKMGKEKRPICKIKMMTINHEKCENLKSAKTCKHVMKCSLGMKMMSKTYPTTVCEDIAIGDEEKCVVMVKLKKDKYLVKDCSFFPRTVCKEREGKHCRMVHKILCQYVEKN